MQYYENRPASLENLTMAEFTSDYDIYNWGNEKENNLDNIPEDDYPDVQDAKCESNAGILILMNSMGTLAK